MVSKTCKFQTLAFGFFLFIACTETRQIDAPAESHSTQKWKSILREGDVIFRYGYGAVSDWINFRQSSKYNVSHAGMVVQLNQKWMVVHSISGMLESEDGVQACSIEQFIHEARPNTVFILRPKLAEKIKKTAAKIALHCLKKGIRFDHQFNPNDSTEMYCTELIFYCYKQGGIKWSSENPGSDFQSLTDSSLGNLIAPLIPLKETRVH